jgi:hypothetical protein
MPDGQHSEPRAFGIEVTRRPKLQLAEIDFAVSECPFAVADRPLRRHEDRCTEMWPAQFAGTSGIASRDAEPTPTETQAPLPAMHNSV